MNKVDELQSTFKGHFYTFYMFCCNIFSFIKKSCMIFNSNKVNELQNSLEQNKGEKMTLHTMLVMYYKRNDVLIDLKLREIYLDCIETKNCGLFSRQEILKNKTLESYKVENIDFVNERVKIDLYNKHKCTKKEFERNTRLMY